MNTAPRPQLNRLIQFELRTADLAASIHRRPWRTDWVDGDTYELRARDGVRLGKVDGAGGDRVGCGSPDACCCDQISRACARTSNLLFCRASSFVSPRRVKLELVGRSPWPFIYQIDLHMRRFLEKFPVGPIRWSACVLSGCTPH